jgi:hypothetical protein
MAMIAAKRLVEPLDRAGFIVMKKPPAVEASTFGRGYEMRWGKTFAREICGHKAMTT